MRVVRISTADAAVVGSSAALDTSWLAATATAAGGVFRRVTVQVYSTALSVAVDGGAPLLVPGDALGVDFGDPIFANVGLFRLRAAFRKSLAR